MERIDRRKFLKLGVKTLGFSLGTLGIMDKIQLENQVEAELNLMNPKPKRQVQSVLTAKGPLAMEIPSQEENLLIEKYGGITRNGCQLTTSLLGVLVFFSSFVLDESNLKGGDEK